jgi:uncharacterized caspase-like protein
MFHAVIVGVDRYKDVAIPPLVCARADAETLAHLIESRIDKSDRNVRVLLDEDASQRMILTAIGDDLHDQVEKGDVVLLYFACHGSPERRSANDTRSRYILTHDTEIQRIHATSINMDRNVTDWFERLAIARLVVLVLDTCFSGMAGGRSVLGPLLAATPTLQGYMDVERPVSLKGLDLGSGRVILCAASDDQLAREDRAGGHGVFTRHLLAALKRPRDGAGTVRVTVLADEVEAAVRIETAGAQEPIVTMIRNSRASLPCMAGPPEDAARERG